MVKFDVDFRRKYSLLVDGKLLAYLYGFDNALEEFFIVCKYDPTSVVDLYSRCKLIKSSVYIV